jgi:hypothetical protein
MGSERFQFCRESNDRIESAPTPFLALQTQICEGPVKPLHDGVPPDDYTIGSAVLQPTRRNV